MGMEVERYVPEQAAGFLIEAEHQVRYRWAAALAPGRAVLDAGCGVGYGTAILAAAGAARVTGMDVDEGAVADARARVADTAEIVAGDLRALPFATGAFDLVTCFETIEHLREPGAALDELARVLAADGVLAISTPNRHVSPPGNPFHHHEFTPEELDGALRERFASVRLHRQHSHAMSLIADEQTLALDDPECETAVPLHRLRGTPPGGELYTLALAGDGELPRPGNLAVAGGLRDVELLVAGARRAQVRAQRKAARRQAAS